MSVIVRKLKNFKEVDEKLTEIQETINNVSSITHKNKLFFTYDKFNMFKWATDWSSSREKYYHDDNEHEWSLIQSEDNWECDYEYKNMEFSMDLPLPMKIQIYNYDDWDVLEDNDRIIKVELWHLGEFYKTLFGEHKNFLDKKYLIFKVNNNGVITYYCLDLKEGDGKTNWGYLESNTSDVDIGSINPNDEEWNDTNCIKDVTEFRFFLRYKNFKKLSGSHKAKYKQAFNWVKDEKASLSDVIINFSFRLSGTNDSNTFNTLFSED